MLFYFPSVIFEYSQYKHPDKIKRSTITPIGWDGMDWIDQAQDRDQWRALVNTVMNLRVP
jgi:hypothetical protein